MAASSENCCKETLCEYNWESVTAGGTTGLVTSEMLPVPTNCHKLVHMIYIIQQ